MLWELLVSPNPLVAWAAFFGTLVHLAKPRKERQGRREILSVLFVNYFSALFLTELVAEVFSLKFLPGISFMIAVGGLRWVERFINSLFKRVEKTYDDYGKITDDVEPGDEPPLD